MKNIIKLLIVFLVLSLTTSCNSQNTEVSESSNEEITTEVETKEDTEESEPNIEQFVFKTDATIEESVIYDDDRVTIIAKSLEYNNNSATLNLEIENKSSELIKLYAGTMAYSINAINNYMTSDGYLNCEIEAGQIAQDDMSFSKNEMLIHGISEIALIQVGFEITDENRNEAYTGPLEIRTSAFDAYDMASDDYLNIMTSNTFSYTYNTEVNYQSKEELFSENGLSISKPVVMTNKDGEQSIFFEISNESDSTVYYSDYNISINDVLVQEYIWNYDTISAKKRTVQSISLSRLIEKYLESDDSKELGNIEAITFTVEFKNEDGFVVAEPTEITIHLK